jgi:hypothetical protein
MKVLNGWLKGALMLSIIGGDLREMCEIRQHKWIFRLGRVVLVWTTLPNVIQNGHLSVFEIRNIIVGFRVVSPYLSPAMMLSTVSTTTPLLSQSEDNPGRTRILFLPQLGQWYKSIFITTIDLSNPLSWQGMPNMVKGTGEMVPTIFH